MTLSRQKLITGQELPMKELRLIANLLCESLVKSWWAVGEMDADERVLSQLNKRLTQARQRFSSALFPTAVNGSLMANGHSKCTPTTTTTPPPTPTPVFAASSSSESFNPSSSSFAHSSPELAARLLGLSDKLYIRNREGLARSLSEKVLLIKSFSLKFEREILAFLVDLSYDPVSSHFNLTESFHSSGSLSCLKDYQLRIWDSCITSVKETSSSHEIWLDIDYTQLSDDDTSLTSLQDDSDTQNNNSKSKLAPNLKLDITVSSTSSFDCTTFPVNHQNYPSSQLTYPHQRFTPLIVSTLPIYQYVANLRQCFPFSLDLYSGDLVCSNFNKLNISDTSSSNTVASRFITLNSTNFTVIDEWILCRELFAILRGSLRTRFFSLQHSSTSKSPYTFLPLDKITLLNVHPSTCYHILSYLGKIAASLSRLRLWCWGQCSCDECLGRILDLLPNAHSKFLSMPSSDELHDSAIPFVQAFRAQVWSCLHAFDACLNLIDAELIVSTTPASSNYYLGGCVASLLNIKYIVEQRAAGVLALQDFVESQWNTLACQIVPSSPHVPCDMSILHFKFLDALYDRLCTAQFDVNPSVFACLLTCFLAGLRAYLRLVWHWIARGELIEESKLTSTSVDPEFFIHRSPNIATHTASSTNLATLWHDHFIVRRVDNKVQNSPPLAPRFLHSLIDHILDSGKIVVFLRLMKLIDLDSEDQLYTDSNVYRMLCPQYFLSGLGDTESDPQFMVTSPHSTVYCFDDRLNDALAHWLDQDIIVQREARLLRTLVGTSDPLESRALDTIRSVLDACFAVYLGVESLDAADSLYTFSESLLGLRNPWKLNIETESLRSGLTESFIRVFWFGRGNVRRVFMRRLVQITFGALTQVKTGNIDIEVSPINSLSSLTLNSPIVELFSSLHINYEVSWTIANFITPSDMAIVKGVYTLRFVAHILIRQLSSIRLHCRISSSYLNNSNLVTSGGAEPFTQLFTNLAANESSPVSTKCYLPCAQLYLLRFHFITFINCLSTYFAVNIINVAVHQLNGSIQRVSEINHIFSVIGWFTRRLSFGCFFSIDESASLKSSFRNRHNTDMIEKCRLIGAKIWELFHLAGLVGQLLKIHDNQGCRFIVQTCEFTNQLLYVQQQFRHLILSLIGLLDFRSKRGDNMSHANLESGKSFTHDPEYDDILHHWQTLGERLQWTFSDLFH